MKYLKKFQLNEGVTDSYSKVIMPELDYHGIYLDGNEINEITCNEIRVNFTIEIEGNQSGITDILVYNFKGPSELTLEISFYPNDGEDTDPVDKEITIPLNWESAVKEKSDVSGGGITIEELKIELSNEEAGGFVVPSRGSIRNTGKILAKNITVITNEL